MRTPAEIEHAWAVNGVVAQAGGARTATTGEVDETSPAGLSAPQIEAIHPHRHLLLSNNDRAA
jgi:hypothetical protein